jgi:predicted RNase H-like nuclease (RuvC/YqgF family)
LVDHPDTTPVANEIKSLKMSNNQLEKKIKSMKDANKNQKSMLKKEQDNSNYDLKIEALLQEVTAEKIKYRKLSQRKLKELHKNYGADENDF